MKTWLRNLRNVHQRLMAYYLRRRSWVVFYLEEEHRQCKDICWLKLYESEEKAR